ncbi:DUF805 domain-containing protein [Massilia sp. CF038]|uniref:DUF805 domain-containing protein n=1 Tax=Massilia sp. CF038 TaxID=1881045 RepID=UPI000916234F|nr:DUF805 domain-containing protein [Massilia sp. CF038]SHH04779.1 Uncharacterized membrane protein YhaH, DUF805 family [Massilia sp. CF038]
MSNPYNAPAADMSHGSEGVTTYEPKILALNGRIGRLRYLAYSFVFGILAMFALGIIAAVTMAISPKLMLGVVGVLYIPVFAVTFILARRRFNDMDRSGWFSLLLIIPFVNFFVSLWLLFGPGDQGENDFGLPPCKNSTGVVIGALSIPVFGVLIGILAAIAMPAYQDYTMRARAAQMQSQEPASALPGSQE